MNVSINLQASANKNNNKVGVVIREIFKPYIAIKCQFVGRLTYALEDNALFGYMNADSQFVDCNFSFNVSRLNNPNLKAAVITSYLNDNIKLDITRCQFFDSFLDGTAQLGLVVGHVKANARLTMNDSWSTNCRLENRDVG